MAALCESLNGYLLPNTMKQDQIIYQGDTSYTAMDGMNKAELELAGYVCHLLTQMYPGHPWPVEVHIGLDGIPSIRIRHWAMSAFGAYCYHIDGKDIISPTSLHSLVLTGGGEILERLGLPRVGGWDGSLPETVEDTDPRFYRENLAKMH